MATLTNTKIKDTYDGLLKTTDNDVLDVSGVTLIEDGLGNASALSLGRAGNGVTITGSFRIYNEDDDSNVRIIAGDNDSSIYSDRLLNIYTSSNDAITFSTNGESQTRMTIAANGNVSIEEDLTITGALIASGLNYPTTDGTVAGQAIVTDAAGNLSFATVIADTPNLQEVTDVSPASTTNAITVGGITAAGYVYPTSGGTAGQAIVTDGAGNLSFDTVTGTTPTLDQVTAVGETSSRDIEVNGLTVGKGNNSRTNNAALGVNALTAVTTGNQNTAIGSYALEDNTIGINNTAIGYRSLRNNTSGASNVAIGDSAMGASLAGSLNIAIGSSALNDGDCEYCIAIGDSALGNNTSNNNTSIGAGSLSNINGANNVALGYEAGDLASGGSNKTLGDNNVYIGANVVSAAADTDNEIVIGANATGNGSNSATYGNSSITKHIFTSGNVGIGTSNPTSDVHLQRNVNGDLDLFIQNANAGSSATATLNIAASGNNFKIVNYPDADTSNANRTDIGSSAGGSYLTFTTANSERMRIDSSGVVNIAGGTLELASQAEIIGSSDNLKISADPDNVSGGSTIEFLVDGSEKMRIDNAGNVGIGTSNAGAKIEINASGGGIGGFTSFKTKYGTSSVQSLSIGQVTAGNGAWIGMAQYRAGGFWQTEGTAAGLINFEADGVISFSTNSGLTANTDYNKTERMRIDSSGNVKINGSGILQIRDDGSYIYENNGLNIGNGGTGTGRPINFLTENTERMRITSSGLLYVYNLGAGGATTDINYNTSTGEIYYVTSSARYKENIEELQDSALDKINNLKVKTFDYIDSEEFKGQVGLIAEEVNEHLPFLVNKREIEGYEEPQPDSVKYSMLSVYLLKAIQELNDKVVSLEERLSQYEAK